MFVSRNLIIFLKTVVPLQISYL